MTEPTGSNEDDDDMKRKEQLKTTVVRQHQNPNSNNSDNNNNNNNNKDNNNINDQNNNIAVDVNTAQLIKLFGPVLTEIQKNNAQSIEQLVDKITTGFAQNLTNSQHENTKYSYHLQHTTTCPISFLLDSSETIDYIFDVDEWLLRKQLTDTTLVFRAILSTWPTDTQSQFLDEHKNDNEHNWETMQSFLKTLYKPPVLRHEYMEKLYKIIMKK